MQEFTISVGDILGRPGRYRDFSLAASLPGVKTALARLTTAPVEVDARAEAVLEGVLVTGRVKGQAIHTCARCLRELTGGIELEVCELFLAPGHDAPPEEEFYEVSGEHLELQPMLRDVVALALPLNPLCNEDCKGLCALCGRDLNQGECGCKQEESDPRWAPLEELKQRLEAQDHASQDA